MRVYSFHILIPVRLLHALKIFQNVRHQGLQVASKPNRSVEDWELRPPSALCRSVEDQQLVVLQGVAALPSVFVQA